MSSSVVIPRLRQPLQREEAKWITPVPLKVLFKCLEFDPEMKLSTAVFAACVAGVTAFNRGPLDGSIKADSDLGMKLLSKARNLADNEQISWVSGYSLKFQGCHHIQQWNSQAEGKDDVKVATKNLVRFRLCPTSSCSASKAAGCTGGYGDYIIDMKTYINAYFEVENQKCESFLNSCDCADAENQEYCKYDCAVAGGMTQCVEANPYEEADGEQVATFAVDNYLACGILEGYNRARKLQENAQYYLGPYCAKQGGAIYMGLFTDDTCTEYADDTAGVTTFTELTGQSLPYSAESLVGMDCISCAEQNDEMEENGGDTDTVGDQCANIYSVAGKCETSLPDNMVETKNTNGCSFIDGIKIVRADGLVATSSKKSAVATAFIVIFAMLFCAMAFYVWYLRKRIGIKKNSLM